MSWHGFKKAVNRATISVMQSTGAIEKTVDKDFEEEERRFKVLETKIERLHKEAKGYLDAVRAMTLASKRIATVIDNYYDESSHLGYAGIKYKETIERLDEEARTVLDTNYQTCILQPLGKLIGGFPEINEAVKKRNKKLLDFDAARSKVRKLVEKPSDDPSKLPRAEQEANQTREVYETLNRQLVTELPKLIDLRVPYLDPSFEALVKSQHKFCQEAYEKLVAISGNFSEEDKRAAEGQVERVLMDMRQLTICGSGANVAAPGAPQYAAGY